MYRSRPSEGLGDVPSCFYASRGVGVFLLAAARYGWSSLVAGSVDAFHRRQHRDRDSCTGGHHGVVNPVRRARASSGARSGGPLCG